VDKKILPIAFDRGKIGVVGNIHPCMMNMLEDSIGIGLRWKNKFIFYWLKPIVMVHLRNKCSVKDLAILYWISYFVMQLKLLDTCNN